MPGAAVEPNPRVGAVVVHAGAIIGEGAHEFFGGPHAEVNAIRSVKTPSLLPDSTLYVSLEPCNHHGKTPPCTQLILDSGIKKVVVGAVDPNPQMSGKSIDFLRSQGVDVFLADDECGFEELNRHFEVNQREKRPFISLKWSESSDGFISGFDSSGLPEPRAISGKQVNRHFHWLRHELQAILIGKNTALIDNPSLTTRHWPGRNPLRTILDQRLELPESLQIFQGVPTVVINAIKDEQIENCRFWKVEDSHDLPNLLRKMYSELKIGSILVEGGRDLLQQFLDVDLWDEIYRCTSPNPLEAGIPSPNLPINMTPAASITLGNDRVDHFRR
ncbi:MAG: hypothetical protein RLZZ519_2281 [Bacteroidota bacterium]|jgi:diaminohydroxyphosphoribosylaminopyrimidine deaminase/5-amino-6-(5-phosphoribosylamino)uracil reductase